MNSMFSPTLNTIKKFTQVSRHLIWYKMQIKLIMISFLILKMAEISWWLPLKSQNQETVLWDE